LSPKNKVEAKDYLLDVIEIIETLKMPFKADHIIDIMRGRVTADIKSYAHEQLEIFGCDEKEDPKFLNAVIRQAIIAGYLSKDIENFGLIELTEAGLKFKNNPVSFKIVEDNDFTQDDDEPSMKCGSTSAIDPGLFNILKDMRAKVAKRLNLPPYVIFQDPSLEAMATMYPVNLDELQNIVGVGAGKAKRYGKEFVDFIKNYVEENEIERPEDIRVRTIPNHSLKISIIQSIDRKIALDEVAASNNMDFDKLLSEIEAIVYSGTKLNINYYIDDVLDEDLQDEIYNYFRESESDDVNTAYKELDGEYTEEEIRLVRIKFMSDLAN
jgi:ATP-dependent DNA helicase RecQ